MAVALGLGGLFALLLMATYPVLIVPILGGAGYATYRVVRGRQDQAWRISQQEWRQREAEAECARVQTLGDVLTLTPTEFENVVATLLSVHGFHAVRNLGGSGDLAADIICLDSQEARAVVQCKRYAPGNPWASPPAAPEDRFGF
jgi:hypothetical protein